ncbi:hypothetical protein Acr_14g0007040 [Actinidia rufa]|uniref:Uncharacterized protein n=1 Tax=Actinidia rufa TaxID=165716 RepID=A0A7J0FQS0_9ERIC|nr:hypothetical protein Acr_14g0007040 [Actinidia rufa]
MAHGGNVASQDVVNTNHGVQEGSCGGATPQSQKTFWSPHTQFTLDETRYSNMLEPSSSRRKLPLLFATYMDLHPPYSMEVASSPFSEGSVVSKFISFGGNKGNAKEYITRLVDTLGVRSGDRNLTLRKFSKSSRTKHSLGMPTSCPGSIVSREDLVKVFSFKGFSILCTTARNISEIVRATPRESPYPTSLSTILIEVALRTHNSARSYFIYTSLHGVGLHKYKASQNWGLGMVGSMESGSVHSRFHRGGAQECKGSREAVLTQFGQLRREGYEKMENKFWKFFLTKIRGSNKYKISHVSSYICVGYEKYSSLIDCTSLDMASPWSYLSFQEPISRRGITPEMHVPREDGKKFLYNFYECIQGLTKAQWAHLIEDGLRQCKVNSEWRS